MMFLNLTPHVLNIHLSSGRVMSLSPTGDIARVEEDRAARPAAHGVPVTRATYGAVTNLPAPAPGVCYIVSALVLAAVPDRADVFAPGPAVRNDAGQIVGAQGLSCTPAYAAPIEPTPTPESFIPEWGAFRDYALSPEDAVTIIPVDPAPARPEASRDGVAWFCLSVTEIESSRRVRGTMIEAVVRKNQDGTEYVSFLMTEYPSSPLIAVILKDTRKRTPNRVGSYMIDSTMDAFGFSDD